MKQSKQYEGRFHICRSGDEGRLVANKDENPQALRRSIKGDKSDSKVSHISITPKSALAIQPPKKVCSSSMRVAKILEGVGG